MRVGADHRGDCALTVGVVGGRRRRRVVESSKSTAQTKRAPSVRLARELVAYSCLSQARLLPEFLFIRQLHFQPTAVAASNSGYGLRKMKYTFELLHQGQARLLVSIFIAWKLFLVSLAVLCPGPGYDTSALILLSDNGNRELQFQSFSLSDRFTLNLLRWDALYFVKAAERGYVYEQEWAFSRAYSLVLSAVKDRVLFYQSTSPLSANNGLDILRLPEPSLNLYIWTGIAVSNICHLISVLVLYRFVCLVLRPRNDVRIPFIAATLHIFSPAGIILSAAYSESLFSALHFTGMLYYVLARQTSEASSTWGASQDVYMLSSGLFFAVATLVRGNGLLSGLIFLFDVTSIVPRILALQLDANETRRIIVTCVAGLILASGFITPQFLAYQEFCAADSSGLQTRPWCHKWIPSIYSWVQSHYW